MSFKSVSTPTFRLYECFQADSHAFGAIVITADVQSLYVHVSFCRAAAIVRTVQIDLHYIHWLEWFLLSLMRIKPWFPPYCPTPRMTWPFQNCIPEYQSTDCIVTRCGYYVLCI